MTASTVGAKIAEGRTAEVFAYGEGKVVKLFRPEFPRDSAEYDYDISRQVAPLYPGAPAVHGKVEIDGRLGVVYERLEGKSLVQATAARPWKILWAADLSARVHQAIVASPADGLPSQKDGIEWAITRAEDLTPEEKRRIISYLHTLPDGGALCHGDFHPDNVLLSARGPVVIDWVTASRGCPAGDLARSIMIAESPGLPPGLSPAASLLIRRVKRLYSRRYRRRVLTLCGIAERDMEAWILPLSAARLVEGNAPEETAYHLRRVRERLGAL